MEKIEDGGNIFPQVKTEIKYNGSQSPEHHIKVFGGMTLRDYFAGQALIGLLARSNVAYTTKEDAVKDAFEYADAMLKARNPQPERS